MPRFIVKMTFLAIFSTKTGFFVNFLCWSAFFKLFLKSKKSLALVLKVKSANFKERGQGERSRRYAIFRRISVCRISISADLGNSPFGAWVVCVYRSRAMQSLTLVNATTHAFFVSIQNWQGSLRSEGELHRY